MAKTKSTRPGIVFDAIYSDPPDRQRCVKALLLLMEYPTVPISRSVDSVPVKVEGTT